MDAPTGDTLLACARRAANAAAQPFGIDTGADAEAAAVRACLRDLAAAFTKLDAALTAGSPLPHPWAASADAAQGWRAAFRNSAGHTVAVAHLDSRLTYDDARTRVTTDMGVYCSWLVRDALVTGHDHRAPVVVPNPAHERTRAELARHTHPHTTEP
ncbi:hypothetical protein OG216_08655 [Streptomycetaceae bacterium NBC_01309]